VERTGKVSLSLTFSQSSIQEYFLGTGWGADENQANNEREVNEELSAKKINVQF
jgi:hypothetical protein